MSRLMRSKVNKNAITVVIVLVVILGAVLGGVAIANSNGDNIFKGVKVDNISLEIEGKSKEEATEELKEYQNKLSTKQFTLVYDKNSMSVTGEDIGLRVSQDFIEEAYEIGRASGDFGTAISSFFGGTVGTVSANITIDEANFESKINNLIQGAGASKVDAKVARSGDTITITKGHDGINPEIEKAQSELLANAGFLDVESTVTISADIDKSEDVDFNKLFKDVFVAKKDAALSSDGSYTKEVVGTTFDINKAIEEYEGLKPDGEMQIVLVHEQPEITTENLEKVLFADVLGSFKTTYNASNKNRSNNLELAGKSINNKIYLPGETFSYNDALGERTAARGYKEAHVYSGGEVVDGLGGGICQISSTLYNAVLKADLEIVERKNHMFWPEYVDPSFDATVAWGSIDFKFKNNRETPIKITASVSGGTASVTIYGKKKADEPTIELLCKKLKEIPAQTVERQDPNMNEGKRETIQSPVRGYDSEGYKIYKDANGKEIKRELISKDHYDATNKIVKVGTKKVVTPVPTVKPTTAPTARPTQAPTPTPFVPTQAPTHTPDPNLPPGWEGWY